MADGGAELNGRGSADAPVPMRLDLMAMMSDCLHSEQANPPANSGAWRACVVRANVSEPYMHQWLLVSISLAEADELSKAYWPWPPSDGHNLDLFAFAYTQGQVGCC